ncbi:6-bladed beta-propeller [Parabacteroides sp. PF5-6]|uniref:6-bladed beta-propeller n=1 Tax=Parabacteroides sp. PF5-6 TaxID=1742403 RepID=UPI0024062E39|nr:6-bladed beta-propeller [Parabacteroides sp. PF5-6]MDF9829319.1 hypothetical protein [Parabacteroides sp. PF5-6]
MKKRFTLWITILFVLTGCTERKTSEMQSDGFITIDVTAKYPKKELLLQDLADVSYVTLQTKEEYLFNYPSATITNDFIIVKNENGQGFLFFDKSGKAISKVNRKGEGPEEYVRTEHFVYVDEEDKLYITVWINSKIKVYNKEGRFEKEYSTPKDMRIEGMYNYDDEHLLLYFAEQQVPFALFSKADGNISFLTDIFIEEPKDMLVRFDQIQMADGSFMHNGFFYFPGYYVVKNDKDFLLTEYGSDTTAYRISPDKTLTPALVRKPSFEETDPKIALHSFIETSKSLFLSSVRLEYDQKTFKAHPKTAYIIDKKDKQIYTQHIINSDFEDKEFVIDPSTVNTFVSPYAGIVHYSKDELAQADKQNKLKGELKEAFEQMGDEDEYLFMLFTIN